MGTLGNSESVRRGNAKEARPSRSAPAREVAEAPAPEVAERSAEAARGAASEPEGSPEERFRERLKKARPDLDGDALANLWRDIGQQSPEAAEHREQGRRLRDR